MVLIALALAASAPTQAPRMAPAVPARQAQATVRILRPASLRVGAERTLEGQPVRRTMLPTPGGPVTAFLAEFE